MFSEPHSRSSPTIVLLFLGTCTIYELLHSSRLEYDSSLFLHPSPPQRNLKPLSVGVLFRVKDGKDRHKEIRSLSVSDFDTKNSFHYRVSTTSYLPYVYQFCRLRLSFLLHDFQPVSSRTTFSPKKFGP